MSGRIAAFFGSLRLFPGGLTSSGRRAALLLAAFLMVAATAVFVRTTWNEALSDAVITFTMVFVGAAVLLVGLARKKDPED